MTQLFNEDFNKNYDSTRNGVGDTKDILANSTIRLDTATNKNLEQNELQDQKLDISSKEFKALEAELVMLYQKNSSQERQKVLKLIDIIKKGDTGTQEVKDAKEELEKLKKLYQEGLSTLEFNEGLYVKNLVNIMQENDIYSQEFKDAKKELIKIYQNRKSRKLDRVIQIQEIMQDNGILFARSPEIRLTKIPLISKTNERWIVLLPTVTPEEKQKGITFEEKLKEIGLEEKLTKLGFEKRDDGKWYHINRDCYKNPLESTDVIYIFKRDKNGDPVDTGFGPKTYLKKRYIRSQDFDNKKYEYIDPISLNEKEGAEISVKKLASGAFCILPTGSLVFTPKGVVEVKAGQVVVIKEDIRLMNVMNLTDVLKIYQPDGIQPASKDMFKLLEGFSEKNESIEEYNKILNMFTIVNRGTALCKIACKKTPETLRDLYKVAANIAGELDEKYLSKIDVTNFDSAIKQAEKILLEIKNDPELSEEYRNLAITSVMVKLLPKTNAHQHLKGSTPKDVILELAEEKFQEKIENLKEKIEFATSNMFDRDYIHSLTVRLEKTRKLRKKRIERIKDVYNVGGKGYESLHKFNENYSVISKQISTKKNYEKAIQGIVNEALRQGQLIVEIRVSCDKIIENGKICTPERGAEILINAIQNAKNDCINKGITPPKIGLVFLSNRRRVKDKNLKSDKIHAQIAVNSAEKYPNMKFGFDVAGPEDTGYPPESFREAIDIIKSYNNDPKRNGHSVGITMHAGETPTFNNSKKEKDYTENDYTPEEGYKAVLQAINLGVDRIGHGVQAINGPDGLILKKIKELGITIEICGICNISTIPKNTKGYELHPIQNFLASEIPVTICTDNDAICSTNITKEYLMFLMTGHSNIMDWNALKKVVRNGIRSAFIPDVDKDEVSALLEERIKQIQVLYNQIMDNPE